VADGDGSAVVAHSGEDGIIGRKIAWQRYLFALWWMAAFCRSAAGERCRSTSRNKRVSRRRNEIGRRSWAQTASRVKRMLQKRRASGSTLHQRENAASTPLFGACSLAAARLLAEARPQPVTNMFSANSGGGGLSRDGFVDVRHRHQRMNKRKWAAFLAASIYRKNRLKHLALLAQQRSWRRG